MAKEYVLIEQITVFSDNYIDFFHVICIIYLNENDTKGIID